MPTVDELIVKLKAENTDLRNKLNQSKGDINNFGNTALKWGGVLVGLFAIKEAGEFAIELSKVAGAAEGVRTAFTGLDGITLDKLRQSVDGTVDDLTLMKAAVRAENFKIPLEKLGTFFEFATKRATQTGESVDYLVNSIIDGIGRKSSLVLDNLGISATELQEEIKKVGDFGAAAGNIVERELGKMGNVAETTGAKYDRMAASWTNFTISLGNFINQSPLVGEALDLINEKLNQLADFIDPMAAQWTELRAEADETAKVFKKMSDTQIEKWIEVYRGRMKDATADMGRFKEQAQESEDAIHKAWAGDKAMEAQKEANKYFAIIQALEGVMRVRNQQHLDAATAATAEAEAMKKLNEEVSESLRLSSNKVLTPDFGGADYKDLFPGLSEDEKSIYATLAEIEREGREALQQEYDEGNKAFDEQFKRIQSNNAQVEDEFNRFSDDMSAMVSQFATQVITEFARAMGEFIAEGSANPRNFGKKFLQIFAEFLQTVGALMIAFGNAGIAFEAAKDSGQYYAAIYAGVALTAAGAAIAAAIRKGPSYGGGGSSYAGGTAALPDKTLAARQFQNVQVQGEVRVEGSDIVIAIRNADNQNNRGGVNYGYGG